MYFHVQITALGELCCVALSFEYFSEQNQSNQSLTRSSFIQTVNFIRTNTPNIYLGSVG